MSLPWSCQSGCVYRISCIWLMMKRSRADVF